MHAPRPATLAGFATLALLLSAFAGRPEIMERLELALLDWRFIVRGPVESDAKIIIVAIDAKSVDEVGRWPWRRSRVAELIDRLSDGGAMVIGVDMVFSEPEDTPESRPLMAARSALALRAANDEAIIELDRALLEADTDARLAEALEQSDRVVLGYFFRTERKEVPVTLEPGVEDTLRRSRVSVVRVPEDSRAPVLRCSDAETNLPSLHKSARRSGFFTADQDIDGAVRHAPLIVRCANHFYISLPLAMAELAYGSRSVLVGDDRKLEALRIDDVQIPIDERGQILVNYLGPTGSIPHISAADVLAGRTAPDAFEGQLVLIGVTEVGLVDQQTTPFGPAYPGIEVHANVLDNLMTQRILVHRDDLVGLELALIVAIAMLITFAIPRLHTVTMGALLTLVLAVALFAVATWSFVAQGVWLNIAYPGATLVSTYLAVTIAASAVEQRRGRMLRRQFASYVPPAVVDEIVRHPDRFSLRGERRDLSILFSNVRDFTTLSENIGADHTTALMNTYLTQMTKVIFDTLGTLDKYIGDAVVCFWNAPLEVAQHPRQAARAALAMQRESARLRTEPLTGADALIVGIGLHAGEVVVGDLGSLQHREYSITGDGVNLCSRLEGLTKHYGVDILASEAFVTRLGKDFEAREVDRVRVKGRREAGAIFELLDAESLDTSDDEWRFAYSEALETHRRGDFESAIRLFDHTDSLRPLGDGPSRVMRKRAQALLDRAKAGDLPDWDGIHTFSTK